METTGSLSQGINQLYCPVRCEWVAALPEEIVRQKLVHHMVERLGFSRASLAVEVALKQIPHLKGNKVPDRRADILCFGKNIHPKFQLYPLLLVECKAVKLTSKVLQQVIGYNHFVQSYFITVANDDEIRTGWYDANKGDYTFVSGLPPYSELIASVHPS